MIKRFLEMLSRSEAIAFREQARALALQIGLRPAARAIGIKEDRIRQWARRYHWQISLIRPTATNATLSPNVTPPLQALANVMHHYAERTRTAMARTSMRAFEHSDTLNDEELHEMERAIALEKHGRNASVAHAWNTPTANVAVLVNVPLPTAEEREEMRSMDAKLDAIAAKLRA